MNRKMGLVLSICTALIGLCAMLFGVSHFSVMAERPATPAAAIMVDTLDDDGLVDGDCSLREAIQAANTNASVDTCPAGDGVITDTITFDVAGTITLTEQLSVTAGGALVIDGGTSITVSGNDSVRAFYVNTEAEVTLSDLAITDGYVNGDFGGGIFNLGSLTIINSTLSGNRAVSGSGGGIYNGSGELTIISSTLSDNSVGSEGGGGGIFNSYGTLTMTSSTLSGNSAPNYGGGIYSYSGTLTITDSTLSDNSTGFDGGGAGIYNYSGMMTIINSTLSGNSADYNNGGGIFNIYGTLIIIGSTLSDNSVGLWSGGGGGGISNFNGMLSVISSTLTGNSAGWAGGGISSSGPLTIINSTLSGNSAGSQGGGILSSGPLTITKSTLSGNSAYFGGGISNSGILNITNSNLEGNSATFDRGGGIYNSYGRLTIGNSTLSGNSAATYGGGIYIDQTEMMTITNSTLSGNSSLDNGGGIFFYSGIMNITNSTLTGNSTGSQGGGIFIHSDNQPEVSLSNSIIANSPSGGNCAGYPVIDASHNLEDTDTCGLDPANGSLPNTDPLLGPLQDNGGPTWTHALLETSPAIDTGDNATCPLTDQRGFPRPLDGNGDWQFICDIGSYEFVQGIALIPIHQSNFGAPGATVEYTFNLYNFANLTDTYSLALGTHGWETWLSASQVGPLEPGEAASFTVSVTVPLDAEMYDADSVVVTATSQTSPTVYSALAQVITQAYAPPQISIDPLSMESSQVVGQIITQLLTISNGNGVTLTYDIYAGVLPENVASLHLDEAQGSTTFYDASGSGNNATCSGDTCPAAGIPGAMGTALSFDGLDDSIQIYHNTDFDQIEDQDRVTIAAWVYLSREALFPIINQYEADNDEGWEFDVDTWALSFWQNPYYPDYCYYPFNINQRYHVAVTYDHNQETIQYYVDGSQVCDNSYTGDIQDTVGEPMYIGYSPAGGEEYAEGLIDELYIYKRALSQEEILLIYQSGSVHWLSVDPVSGSVPTNSSATVQVTFDATATPTGVYETTFFISSNDPLNPIVQIPVTMTVAVVAPLSVEIDGPLAGLVGESYVFTATVSPISTTLPIEYAWQASGQEAVTHTGGLSDTLAYIWDSPGTQLITVTAANFGGTVTDTHTLTISDVPINGLLASSDGPTLLGESTTFTATVEAGTNIGYAWDFGDDSTASGTVVTHTYAAAGVYTATVTASNGTGSEQAGTLVYVISPETKVYLPVIPQGDTPGTDVVYWRRQE